MTSVLAGAAPAGPAELAGKLLAAWVGYSLSGAGATAGLDRMPVALHGWSYAQTDPDVKAALRASMRGFRERCAPLVKRWQAEGVVAADADPDAVAQLMLSISLGFVAQRSLTGDADAEAQAAALAALTVA